MRKTKRTMTVLALVALAALVTICISRGTRRVQAQDNPPPQPDRISFGMVGITRGETIRLSVVNTVPPPIPDRGELPPGATRVVLTFLNSDGQHFRNRDGSPVRRVAMLQPGQSTFLDLDADDLQYPPGPSRLQLRAVVTAFPPPVGENPPPIGDIPPPTPDRIVPSVEVFNSSNSKTVVFIGNPGVIRGFNPQPDPPLGQ